MSKHPIPSLFDVSDFRVYLRSWAASQGRGQYRKLAHALKMHTTQLSQVMSGRKCLTEEQVSRLSLYLKLGTLETDCLLKLIQIERAGTEDLRSLYQRHLKEIRNQSREVKHRVPDGTEMSEKERGVFYSSWQLSVVRLLTSIEKFQTPQQIAARLNIPIGRVNEILTFLVSCGLCTKKGDGRFVRTDKNTHVEATSPMAVRHHQNWRTKVMELQERMSLEDLAFSAPVSIAEKDIDKVRAILVETISRLAKLIEKSPSEEIVYLGIDWIRM